LWIEIIPNKFHEILLINQDLSNSTKGTIPIIRNFQLWFNLIFTKEIIQYSWTSKCHGTKCMQSSLRAFQRHQEHNLKHPSVVVDLITIKTRENKLPSFMDRYLPKFVYRPNLKTKQN
jgi:hypothetical protein